MLPCFKLVCKYRSKIIYSEIFFEVFSKLKFDFQSVKSKMYIIRKFSFDFFVKTKMVTNVDEVGLFWF
ncbi:hypothetical protein BXY58_2901 [Epilithonimonas arachidiradicis]|uniref:Uncharacterized protein n=1 Tax=Epilithonimonas arachidiradicis TaxID=1617282 RepID=A0A420CPP0_9FLAO|nr:hypothetical protein BXY58_2901 [Epilithonimonas arachidiradicis]